MKFWAFLKDSYREAVSGWVLPTMLILVTIFVFFVASMSFRQVNFKEDMAFRMRILEFFLKNNDPTSSHPTYTIENFEQTNQEVEPWLGDYRFEIVATYRSEEDFKRGAQSRLEPRFPEQLQMELKLLAPHLKDFTVSKGDDAAPKIEPKADPKVQPKQDEAPKPETQKLLRFRAVSKGSKVQDPKAWMHTASLFFGAIEIPFIQSQRQWVLLFQTTLVNDVGIWLILLVTIIVSAGAIPNTMRKGALDLFISKPVSRFQLLLYRFIGGLVFTSLIVAFMIGAVYLLVGIRYDFWSINFLGMIPLITFYFAILYSISTLFGVLTRNMLVSILLVIVFWGVFSYVGARNRDYLDAVYLQQKLEKMSNDRSIDEEKTREDLFKGGPGITGQFGPSPIAKIGHYIHNVTPRTWDLDMLSSQLVADGVLTADEMKDRNRNRAELPSWGGTIAVSSIFIALMLGLSYWRFATRDG